MDMGLTGKVAIITGGSEGIGFASAMSMAREGARVAIAARRPDVLEAAAERIRTETGNSDVIGVPTDARDEAQVQALVRRVVEQWGTVDILVNNAGTSAAAKFENVTDETWDGDLRLKVYGAIYCVRAVVPLMQAAGGGRIINITVPTRYLHSHTGVIHRNDVAGAVRLVTEVVRRLDEATVARIRAFD